MMTDCPFCDYQGGFSQELAYHLGNSHADKLRDGVTSRWNGSVICWCGEGPFGYMYGPYEAVSQLCVHLQRHGGATAHWLEYSLGLAVKP